MAFISAGVVPGVKIESHNSTINAIVKTRVANLGFIDQVVLEAAVSP